MAFQQLLDAMTWIPIEALAAGGGLYATHYGLLRIGDIELRVYQLNNGTRVIEEGDLLRFFGWLNGNPT